jgi:uncharacterized membrane protein YecN with MAPEG domain
VRSSQQEVLAAVTCARCVSYAALNPILLYCLTVALVNTMQQHRALHGYASMRDSAKAASSQSNTELGIVVSLEISLTVQRQSKQDHD